MGLICTKASPVEDNRESPPRRPPSSSNKQHLELKVSLLNSSKREEAVWTKDRLGGGDVKVMLMDKKFNGSMRLYDDQTKSKKMEKAEVTVLDHPVPRRIQKAAASEQVAAGWPGWLSAAAGEAVNGWIPRRADTFEKLNKVKCYMQQLLTGLEHCHSHGVLHCDIKGSNLLIDNSGILKIADFGLASFYDPHHSVPLTSRVVTLWYRPPELLLGSSKYGVAVDLWSTGCILGELYSGKPILPGNTEVEQLHKIFKLCGSPSEEYWRKSRLRNSTMIKPPQPYRRCVAETFKDLPAAAVQLMEILLSVDPADRGTAAISLNTEFFTTKPLPCDPSSLPKYPPSKEIDAKLREEEARRQGTIGGSAQKVDLGSREQPPAIAGTNANAESIASVQRRRGQSNQKIRSEMFNPHREEAVSGFLVDPIKHFQTDNDAKEDFLVHQSRRTSLSGPLIHGPGRAKPGKEVNDYRANLSKLSGLVLARTAMSEDQQEKPDPSGPETTKQVTGFPGSFDGEDSIKRQEWRRHKQRIPSSRQMDDEKACRKGANVHGHGPKGNKNFVSGPLLVSSNNVDQMLKEHDRRIQDYARRARIDKTRPRK